MSRLIDADDFKKFLQALCKAGAPYEEVVQLLDRQPTAYDVEKVVAELEEMPTYEFGVTLMNTSKYLKKKDVLRVVRNGGKE